MVCLQCGRPKFNPWVRKILWRRKWQPTPVLLLGRSNGQRSMVGYSPWGHKESDTTERLHFHFHYTFTFTSLSPYGRKQRITKEPLDESERGEWTCWLKTQHSKNEDHGIWSHHFMANRWRNSGNSDILLFWGAPKSLQMVTVTMKLKDACFFEEKLWPT